MERSYKKKSNRIFLFGLAFLLIVFGCHVGELGRPETSSIRIKGGNEILVVRDFFGYPPVWCGNKRLIYSLSPHPDSTRGEIFQYDVETDLHTEIAKPSWPRACTGDGEWLVYSDNNSYRPEKGNPNNAVDDLWRYEFKTKRRQRIAVVSEDDRSSIGESILSPTGFTLYLGRKPGESVEMPEPEWEIIWTRNDMSNAAWLPDLSGILQEYYTREDRAYHLALELFGSENERITLEPPLPSNARNIQMAGPNRVYLKIYRRMKGPERHEKDLIISCEINRSEATLSCVDVLELNRSVRGYQLLSDGETIVFTEQGDRCVRIKYKGESEARCITSANYRLGYYIRVSPDEKWLAFTVSRKRDDERSYTTDLYIAELINY